MLNRRVLRIKVFQAIYSNTTNPALNYLAKENKLTNLLKDFDKAYHLSLLYLVKIAKFTEKKLEIISKKHIEIEDDKIFNTRLLNNIVLKGIYENEDFESFVDRNHLELKIDEDDVKKLFNKLSKKELFKEYSTSQKLDFGFQRKIVSFIFSKVLLKSDLFKSKMEDEFLNWNDDKILIYKTINEKLRKITKDNFPVYPYVFQTLNKESKTFAFDLLRDYHLYEEELFEIIKPQLKNWDESRITMVDKILLNMAVCEFIHLDNIPLKVTLNEYIEISKTYSTLNSKDFINGILDKVMALLKKEGKIKKKGRGLIEF